METMMEINVILPAIAAASVVLLIIGKIYSKLRKNFSKKVNCWFCNSYTTVPYNSSNSWYCPHCDQYNGFWPDGSYNRLLQDQFNEKLNTASWCSKVKINKSKSNGLCNFCNVNLELKVQQLARFVPVTKDNYDEEVQQFSNQLEKVYRLCTRCEVFLDKTLKEKYATYVTAQLPAFKPKTDISTNQVTRRQRHPAYLCLSTLLSLGLLLSVVPTEWSAYVVSNYPLPDYTHQLLALTQQYLPGAVHSSLFLSAGVITHVLDCAYMRDTTSLIHLLMWVIVLCLTHIPVPFDKHVPTVLLLASFVLFMTSMGECRREKSKSATTVKPVQLQKLDGKTNVLKTNTISDRKKEGPSSADNTKTPNSSVSDPKHPDPTPSPIREPTPEDFGLGKLNVSSRRVTRSQSKHFPTKVFRDEAASDMFKARPVRLSPPKLQLDKSFDYQVPPTRSSSQTSGFVSRSPSAVNEDLDSVSQRGGNNVIPYSPSYMSSPFSFPHPYSMPYQQFPHPYSVMHLTPNSFNKFYQYSQMTPYESEFNLSAISIQQNYEARSWIQNVKNVLSSVMILFVITSHAAVLWKVFFEDYFKVQT